MKTKLFLFLISIFLISFISSLQVQTNSTNIQVQYSTNKIIPITITNDVNYTLYNISLISNFTTLESSILQINPNETINRNLILNTNIIGSFIEKITFQGFKLKQCIGGQTQDVHINQFGVEPSEIKICLNDNVKFINDYSQDIFLNLNGFVDTNLCLNNVYTLVSTGNTLTTPNYNVLGLQSFGICNLLINNFINVGNNSITTHNSNDDYILNLNITSFLQNTTLSIDYISQTNFTMNYNDFKTGSIIIRNVGGESAKQISINGEWFLLSDNLFDISPGGTKSVDFTILPSIFSTSQTNKSYSKNIIIKAINSGEINQTISIFITYSNVDADITTPEWWNAKKAFCNAFPTSPYCATEPVTVIKEVPKYACPDIIAKLKAEDILDLLQCRTDDKRTAEAAYNLMKLYAESTNMTIEQAFAFFNITNTKLDENKNSIVNSNNLNTIIYFGTLFVLLLSLGGFIFWKFYNNKLKKKIENLDI